MSGFPRRVNDMANRHAGKLLLVGMAAVAAWNWRQWKRDKALLAERGKPEPQLPLDEWPALPRVSILVAAWNEADIIEAHIESLLGLCYPDKELVLCAGGADGTFDLARRYAGPAVMVLEQHPGEGKQRALRRCFGQATGEVMYLTDADCLLGDEAFERTLKQVVVGDAAASSGRSKPLAGQLRNAFVGYQWAEDQFVALRAPDTSPGLLGRNCAIRSDILTEVGAFDIPALTGTDYELARQLLRAGHTIRYERHSVIETCYPDNVAAYFARRSRWLRNIILIGLRTGDGPQAIRGLLTSSVGTGMLLIPLSALVAGRSALVVWLVALGHGALARVRYGSVHGTGSLRQRLALAGAGILLMGVDTLVWGSVLVQCLVPSWRSWWS